MTSILINPYSTAIALLILYAGENARRDVPTQKTSAETASSPSSVRPEEKS